MKMKISEGTKNIIIVICILIAALLSVGYGINVSSFLSSTTDFLESTNKLSDKKEVKLIKCIDGDTAKMLVDNTEIKIRFLAIDTPETVNPNKKTEEYGMYASKYTCKKLKSSKKIEIAYEEGITKKDKYGRELVWVYLDSKLLQEDLINNGYAKVKYIYAKYSYTDKLLKLQVKAKKNKVGIWSNYIEPNKNDTTHFVTFKLKDNIKVVEVEDGELVNIINNPKLDNYTFSGWMKNNKLYDLSTPITKDITLTPKFKKEY